MTREVRFIFVSVYTVEEDNIMPPKKRKATAPPQASASATKASSRRSKLAKDNDISAEEEAEIKSAWALFRVNDVEGYDEEKEGVIRTEDVQKTLVAQNLAPGGQKELDELIEILDPEEEGYVTYPHFLELSALRLKNKSSETQDEEVEEAFKLFTQGNLERPITLTDLRGIAKVLKEEVGDDVLKAMILEANGGQGVGRGVDRDKFKEVMVRAGVFQ